MDVQFGPNSVEEPNLLYKVQRKVKVFNTLDPLPNRGYNLVTSSSKYALVFVGTPDGYLSTYPLKNLIDNNLEPEHVITKLQEKPTHIAVSCDQELLAVTGGQLLCVYKVADFQAQNVTPALSLRCDTNPSTFVSAMQWNPCIPDSIAIVFFDGTLMACQVSTSQVKKVQSKGRCLCWSPKGKQFVTGNSDGTLTQYKPDLTPAKSVPAPNLFEGCPVETMAVYWISTFQFAVVYKNATDNSRPAVTILNTPKAVQPTCLNYEDICFSMGANRPWYYYLQGLAPWNMILSSSSNSMEIATMGSGDGASWVQWSLADEARAELPFTDKKVENYPIGISIDTSAIHQLPWGENETLPNMPLLLALSQTGLLCLFNIINLNKQAPQLCSPPHPIALPNAALTTAIPGQAPEQLLQAPQTQQQQVQSPQQTAQVQAPLSLPVALAQPPAQLSIPQPVPPAAPKPQPAPQYQPPAQTPQMPPNSASQFGSSFASSGTAFGGLQQPQATSAFGLAEPKPQVEVKPTPTVQPAAPVIQKPTPQVAAAPPKPEQSQEALAAAKAEQERLKAAKLKSMLLKEVNDFQMDLHKFIVKSRGSLGEFQNIMQEIHSNFNTTAIDGQQLKKDCSVDEVRSAVMQVKLELVRASAVLSEARALAEAKTLHEWTQADPLTTKRVASVQKLAYYVQSQIEQAYKALDHKWNSVARDNKFERPGQRMIRPVLDDVYQPLVKQQEILCRQEAVLRTFKNALKDVDAGPMLKSTSLLRSTPFRNNKDPLSKLTKNILNMSIEPETKSKGPLLSAQKLDALRDMLSNHKTIKVKPVNVELREQIAAMRLSYEKNLKEKVEAQLQQEAAQARQQEAAEAQVKQEAAQARQQEAAEPQVEQEAAQARQQEAAEARVEQECAQARQQEAAEAQVKQEAAQARQQKAAQARQQEAAAQQLARDSEYAELQRMVAAQQSQIQMFVPKQMSSAPDLVKVEPKKEIVSPISMPSFTPVGSKPMPGLANVARTLFVDEPKAEPVKAVKVQPKPVAPPQNLYNPKPASLAVQPPTSAAVQPPAADNTRSVLKDLLQKKQANNAAKEANAFANNANTFANNANTFAKGDANTFMGQKICSPTAFSFNAPNVETSEPSAFSTNKPPVRVLDTKNMFGSFQSPAFTIESKPKSSETGEPEATDPKEPLDIKKDDKPLINQLGSKSVLTSNKEPTLRKPQEVPKTDDKVPIKVALKAEQKAKENISEKAAESLLESQKPATDKKESDVKPLGTQSLNFGSSQSANVPAPSESQKPVELKAEIKTEAPKTEEKSTPPKLSLDTTIASSLFAAANASSPTAAKPQSLFGSADPITTQSSPTAVSDTTEKVSVFTTPVSSSASSLFSSAVASQEPKSTQAGSIFSTATSNTSVFANTRSLFGSGAAKTTSSVFGTSTTQSVLTSEAKPSVFSTSTPVTAFSATSTTQSVIASSPSVFAQAAATTTAQSVFASAAPGSIFGTATTQASAFGTSTSTTSVFGTPTTTATSLFGSPPTNQASVFGSPVTTAQSVFGSTTATTQAASVFGGAVQSVFGSSPTTPQTSMFGAPASQSSVFGSAPPSTQASVFGSSPTSTTQSVFGSTPATTTQSSLFGGAESSLFASASISTTSAPTQNSGGSIFGGSPQGSVFGGGATNVFGGKTAFSQSNPTAAAIFGGGAAFGQKQQQAGSFWGNNTGGTATTGFGSGFGQQTQTAPTTSMFGSSGGSFSSPSAAGQAFGNTQAPAFGAAENKPSVFGSPQQQASPGFGGSPVFGGKTVFGQQSSGFGTPPAAGFGGFGGFNKSPSSGFGAPAAFGGGATFGGAPAFGSTSPGKMFGGSPQGGGGFGSAPQSNAMFEDLATQNTLTFGNLAQQSGQAPAPAAPTFNTSPSFSGWRG